MDKARRDHRHTDEERQHAGDDLAVCEVEHAVGEARRAQIMGHHHDRLTAPFRSGGRGRAPTRRPALRSRRARARRRAVGDGSVHVGSFRIVEAVIVPAFAGRSVGRGRDSSRPRGGFVPPPCGRCGSPRPEVPCARGALYRVGPAELSGSPDRRSDRRDDHRARGHTGRLQQGRHPGGPRKRSAALLAAPLPIRGADRDVRCTRAVRDGLESGRQRPLVSVLLRARSDGDLRRIRRTAYRLLRISDRLRDGRLRHARIRPGAGRDPLGRRLLHRGVVHRVLPQVAITSDGRAARARRATRAGTRGKGAHRRCRGARTYRARAARHRRPLRQRHDGSGVRRAPTPP